MAQWHSNTPQRPSATTPRLPDPPARPQHKSCANACGTTAQWHSATNGSPSSGASPNKRSARGGSAPAPTGGFAPQPGQSPAMRPVEPIHLPNPIPHTRSLRSSVVTASAVPNSQPRRIERGRGNRAPTMVVFPARVDQHRRSSERRDRRSCEFSPPGGLYIVRRPLPFSPHPAPPPAATAFPAGSTPATAKRSASLHRVREPCRRRRLGRCALLWYNGRTRRESIR